jgi:hypothetical protein
VAGASSDLCKQRVQLGQRRRVAGRRIERDELLDEYIQLEGMLLDKQRETRGVGALDASILGASRLPDASRLVCI